MWGFEHAGIVPDVVVRRQGDRERPAALGDRVSAASCRSAGAGAPTARRTAATRSRARPGSRSSRRSRTRASSTTPAARGAELTAGLDRIAAEDDRIGDVRGPGLMIGVEFVPRPGDAASPTATLATALVAALRRRGPARPDAAASRHEVVRWIPPIDVTAAEISEAVEIFGEALRTV